MLRSVGSQLSHAHSIVLHLLMQTVTEICGYVTGVLNCQLLSRSQQQMQAQKPIASIDVERDELNAILGSRYFFRSPSLSQFLSYICEKYFQGESDQIKEYSFAVDAFGRSADFHPKEDPIVRVEASRLRKRLKEYYSGEGSDHPIQLTLPPGQYVPVFLYKENGSGHRELVTLQPAQLEPLPQASSA